MSRVNYVHVVQEPYDSLVRILVELQYKAAKNDMTGTYEAANKIMELFQSPKDTE